MLGAGVHRCGGGGHAPFLGFGFSYFIPFLLVFGFVPRFRCATLHCRKSYEAS